MRTMRVDWNAFGNLVAHPAVTSETAAEYKRMPKPDRDQRKDVGGYIFGYCEKGLRSREYVKSRSAISLDIDGCPAGVDLLGMCREHFQSYAWAGYVTHSHTPETPRYRIIVPLAHDIEPEKYEPIARQIAANLGALEWVDKTAYRFTQLMYNPSVPRDVEYQYFFSQGEAIDPENVLSQMPNWQDTTIWPQLPGEEMKMLGDFQKAENPLEKEGWVGAFCNSYTIREAVEKFLPDVYIETERADRFTFSDGSTTGGAIVYEDTWLYSHHATDPACGQLCNAFDLVRIHLFNAERDDISKEMTKRNSYKKMFELCMNDQDVSSELMAMRLDKAARDFSEYTTDATPVTTPVPEKPAENAENKPAKKRERKPAWAKGLKVTKDGKPTNDFDNYALILKNDPYFKNLPGLNLFSQQYTLKGDLSWRKVEPLGELWRDSDDIYAVVYIERTYGISSLKRVQQSLLAVFAERAFHPIRDYLDGLEWDGVPRLENVMFDYFGAYDDEYQGAYNRAAFKNWMTSAVQRIYEPGCQADYVPILHGAQGIRKSTFAKILGGKWYSDSVTAIEGKEGAESASTGWIIELGELEAIRGKNKNAVKNFITKKVDSYRPAYGRHMVSSGRQCVFIGTSNEDKVLSDWTGDRRFWPIDCHIENATKSIATDLPKERDQLWAEAKHLYDNGHQTWFEPGSIEDTQCQWMQVRHTSVNPDLENIQVFLERKLPCPWDEWKKMSYNARKDWLASGEKGIYERECVICREVYCEGLGCFKGSYTAKDARKIGAALSHLGWAKVAGPVRYMDYKGKQQRYAPKKGK